MENYPMREKVTQIQETQRVPIKRNPKNPTPRHIIIKNGKIPTQREILKGSKRETGSNIRGALIRLAADFSTETLQASREWQKIFQVTKNKGLQPRLLYPARLSIKMEGQIRSFPRQ